MLGARGSGCFFVPERTNSTPESSQTPFSIRYLTQSLEMVNGRFFAMARRRACFRMLVTRHFRLFLSLVL